MPKYEERSAGIYRATYVGCRETTFTDKQTNEETTRLVWVFQEVNDPTTAGIIDQMTGTSLKSPNSNAYKIAAGLMGRKLVPGDDTESNVGQLYDVVYGPNQAGNLAITSVVKVGAAAPASAVQPDAGGTAAVPAPTVQGEAEVQHEIPGDLPF